MAMATTIGALPEAEHSKQLRKAVIASTIGTAIEWYDFFLYGTAAGLVFGKLYFPNSDVLAGTLLAFGTYFIGFVGRPIGAAIFGHYGDRIGRKSTLIATLLLMGVATFAVALVPTYESIGIWGAVILTVLRFIQGVGVGGEWGGLVLMSMEWARTDRSRGLVASARVASSIMRSTRSKDSVPRLVRIAGRPPSVGTLSFSLRASETTARPVDPAMPGICLSSIPSWE